jgi:hypothetical protein
MRTSAIPTVIGLAGIVAIVLLLIFSHQPWSLTVRDYPVIELMLLALWVSTALPNWWSENADEANVDERTLGYGAAQNAVQAAVTVSSIVLAGLGVMLGFIDKQDVLTPAIRVQLQYVGILSIIAILLGAVIYALFPSRVRYYNPAHDKVIAVLGFAQLLSAAAGAVRFTIAVLAVLRGVK